jgi:hypothetical protein
MYYIGTYTVDGERLLAEVTTARHTHTPGIASVFGRDDVRLSLTGVWTPEGAKLSGRAAEAPNAMFAAELARIAD